MDFLFNNSFENSYLYIYTVGFEQTKSCHTYGPTKRSGYMIHYVYSGRGLFICEDREYSLSAGDFFFIDPTATIKYIADDKDPWSFYWVGFRGSMANYYLERTTVSKDNPIFTEPSDSQIIKSKMTKLIEISLISSDNDILLNACLLEIWHYLILMHPKEDYIQSKLHKNTIFNKAVNYLQNNYEKKIFISDLAQALSVDRTYLYKVFMNETGVSPKHFLTTIRLNKSKELLLQTDLPINVISNSIGFEDSGNFVKYFKKIENCTPSQFRKK